MARPPRNPHIPSLAGVSPSCVATPAGPWALLADFLAERLPKITQTEWRARMAQGRVLDEHGCPLPPDAPHQAGTRIYYYRELATERPIPFQANVLYQDEWLLVADKPHFLPVTPGGRFVQETLLVRLKQQLGIDTLSPIHRLDRETAGVLVFSLRPQDRGAYQDLFRTQQVGKVYEAIARHDPGLTFPRTHRSRMAADEQFFRQREIPGEPNSETRIELLEIQGGLARYRLAPRSGRTHQLRVHMNALGIPILGDRFYPQVLHRADELADEDYAHPLQLLAHTIRFVDPITGALRQFESQRRLDLAQASANIPMHAEDQALSAVLSSSCGQSRI